MPFRLSFLGSSFFCVVVNGENPAKTQHTHTQTHTVQESPIIIIITSDHSPYFIPLRPSPFLYKQREERGKGMRLHVERKKTEGGREGTEGERGTSVFVKFNHRLTVVTLPSECQLIRGV